jgi:hypothetical protein
VKETEDTLSQPRQLARPTGGPISKVEDMMFPSAMKTFARSEDGAVTVDWVVLTAAIIALVFATFAIITQQSITVGANVVDAELKDAAQYTPGFGSWTRTGGGAGDPQTPPGG